VSSDKRNCWNRTRDTNGDFLQRRQFFVCYSLCFFGYSRKMLLFCGRNGQKELYQYLHSTQSCLLGQAPEGKETLIYSFYVIVQTSLLLELFTRSYIFFQFKNLPTPRILTLTSLSITIFFKEVSPFENLSFYKI
jgi:hypothetical protein